MANAAAAPAAATREESLRAGIAAPVLVAAAEAEAEDEAEDELPELVLEALVVEASEADAVVEPDEVEVEADASVLVLVPELELELLLEQVTSVGRSVTPPRAQIDLATLRVAVMLKHVSWVCSIESSIEIGITYSPDLPRSTYLPHSRKHHSGRTWPHRCT
jgi:hypothetical protein